MTRPEIPGETESWSPWLWPRWWDRDFRVPSLVPESETESLVLKTARPRPNFSSLVTPNILHSLQSFSFSIIYNSTISEEDKFWLLTTHNLTLQPRKTHYHYIQINDLDSYEQDQTKRDHILKIGRDRDRDETGHKIRVRPRWDRDSRTKKSRDRDETGSLVMLGGGVRCKFLAKGEGLHAPKYGLECPFPSPMSDGSTSRKGSVSAVV